MTDAMRARVCPERRTVMVYKTSNRGIVCQQGLNSAATAWPKETSLLCMHCVHGFSGPPVPIPREYNAVLKAYVVYGTFCSLSCAAGWISERHFPDAQYQRVLLGRMAREVLGKDAAAAAPIETAPAQERLAVFGGDLSIDAFRRRGFQGEVWQGFVREPPFVRVPAVLEEHLPRGTAVGLPGMLCKGVAAEIEAVEEEAPATASGVVPRGGLYADFLARTGGISRGEPTEVHKVVNKKRRRGGSASGSGASPAAASDGGEGPRKKAKANDDPASSPVIGTTAKEDDGLAPSPVIRTTANREGKAKPPPKGKKGKAQEAPSASVTEKKKKGGKGGKGGKKGFSGGGFQVEGEGVVSSSSSSPLSSPKSHSSLTG